MPLNALTGTLGKKRAAHLLRRTCFGGSITEIDTFATLTPAQAVAQLFNTELPDPVLPIDPLTGSEWITTGNSQSEGFELEQYFLAWHLGQMLANGIDDSLKLPYIFRERLVFFLHTHFTTKRSVVGSSRGLYYQQALFRLFAFDGEDITIPADDPIDPDTIVPRNFKQLTKKISVDNAMLVFLDGRFNVKGSPNENYARELLELYSIGRGLEGNVPEPEFQGDYYYYTEEDVQAGAQVLSGFNVDPTFSNIDEDTGLPRGTVRGGNIATSHEEGVKSFSSRMGNASVTPDATLELAGNPTEESVLDEISQFVDLIYDQEETARSICREVYRFFVYHQVDQSLQDDIIQEMADIFTANDYKLQPVLEALLTSRHFYEAEAGKGDNNFGSIIKSPLDVVLGFIRNFDIQLPDYETNLTEYYDFTIGVLGEIRLQGMDYYEPFEVAGYPAYHQFPIFNRSWITTNYLTNRYNFIRGSISEGMEMEMGQVDILQFVRNNFPDAVASNARDLIIAVAEYLLPTAENLSFDTPDVGELTVERLNYFLTAFLYSPQLDPDPEDMWTNRWLNGLDDEVIANQLSNLFNAMLQSPEYQLM
ncbi:Protein of unknown function [Ekhidna lutea]|uniref:DUF1800 domain-containing protein n=1 Tax=Ekhidna lutea TaxID=447679 RepID=A0A239FWK0_EKHLU|nr:DUF1800 family protein [Ekhidna lutea]SNS60593.1 Protein of unknown function [Ekhidna lutea]